MQPLKADLVLEGGGVKGIGLVGAASVLEKSGYTFGKIAGTSAGAIVGALLAAGYSAEELHTLMREEIDYRRFRDPSLVDRVPLVGPAVSLILERGVYEGKYLRQWLRDKLAARGVETFADLRDPDPGSALPEWLGYKLVVVAADLSRGEMVRLPWDYLPRYGLDPDGQSVADAVRASMSIPFFFEPAHIRDAQGRTAILVDGGLVSNFPVAIFDRTDGAPPRWPTFGVKLSAKPDATQLPNETGNPYSFLRALIDTMISGHDRMHIADPCVQRRTIFVDTLKVRATDFDIDDETEDRLFAEGERAARDFLAGWSFEDYNRECGQSGAPAEQSHTVN
jgi:NTE family protein